jgi:hypothetical protein
MAQAPYDFDSTPLRGGKTIRLNVKDPTTVYIQLLRVRKSLRTLLESLSALVLLESDLPWLIPNSISTPQFEPRIATRSCQGRASGKHAPRKQKGTEDDPDCGFFPHCQAVILIRLVSYLPLLALPPLNLHKCHQWSIS